MKAALKKFFNSAAAEHTEEAANMATKEGQAEMAAETETAELQALLESATTTLATTQGKLAEMSALYETAQASLKELADAKAALVADAAQKRMDARKEKVVASVGTARADALLAATESLDDSAFEAVVSAMAGSFEAEAKTDAFKEVGVTAPEDKAAVASEPQESEESKLLKAKYQTK